MFGTCVCCQNSSGHNKCLISACSAQCAFLAQANIMSDLRTNVRFKAGGCRLDQHYFHRRKRSKGVTYLLFVTCVFKYVFSFVRITPNFVGVHPDSRYGDGINAPEVMNLISNIFKIGMFFLLCLTFSGKEEL